jgi:hypothetical protein
MKPVLPKKEDGSTNSLGSIPAGRLSRRSPAAKKRRPRMESKSHAHRLLELIFETEGGQYTQLRIQGEFDANKLPEIKQAIIAGAGSEVEVQFDAEQNSFFVGGTAEAVAKVIEILKSVGVEVTDKVTTPDSQMTPGQEPQQNTTTSSQEVIPQAMSTSNTPTEGVETSVGAPLVASAEEGDDAFDPNPGVDDDELLKNGRLDDITHRVLTKLARIPRSKQTDAYRELLFAFMQAVEQKSGASQALLKVAQQYLKSGF